MKKLFKIFFVAAILFVMSVNASAWIDEPCWITGHTYETIKGYAPTCTQSGFTDYDICIQCGLVTDVQQTIPATGHNFGVWIPEIFPTVTREGLNYRECANCGERETMVVDKVNYRAGDLDNNARITPADARLALRMAARLDPTTEFMISISDMNGDGLLTPADARIILRKAARLE